MADPNEDSDETVAYRYRFTQPSGAEREFNVRLDRRTLDLIHPPRESYPEWTKLACCKCPNCTLDEDRHPFCPIAANLVDPIDFFKASTSYEEADVLVETEERTYAKHTTLQKGLSSLIGIYMTTSGCPVMEKLKPMVRTHLPLATLGETTYRVITMYLLAQYFRHRRGQQPDWELGELAKVYDDIRVLNRSFCKRLSHVRIGDASVNAVVILNAFADFVPISIDEIILDELELPFQAYLR